jgi:hypothetical protein
MGIVCIVIFEYSNDKCMAHTDRFKRCSEDSWLTLIRMTKDEKGLAFFKGLLL